MMNMKKDNNLERRNMKKDYLIEELTDMKVVIPETPSQTKKKKDLSINEAAAEFLANPNEETYGVLWERSWWGLRQKIHEIIKDNDMVEDIAIATLQKVWEKRDQYNADIAKFSTWMYRICINEALGYKIRKSNERCVDNDISELYSKTIFQGGQSDAFCDEADKYADKFGKDKDGDIRMLDYEGIVSSMVDTSVNIINNMKDERVKICMIEKNRSVFWPIIESDAKFKSLVSLIKKDDNWELVKNDNMRLEDIAKKYSYPLSSVKNWLHKGKLDLDKIMKSKNIDLYEMWQDVK